MNIGGIVPDFLLNDKFYRYWFFILVCFLVIRYLLRKYIDKLQDAHSGIFVMQDYKVCTKMEYLGFSWEVFLDCLIEPWMHKEFKNVKIEELKEVNVSYVKGPFCPNDNREMKNTRTYIGYYKYKCPKCKYIIRALKNSNTLENDALDEVRSKFR